MKMLTLGTLILLGAALAQSAVASDVSVKGARYETMFSYETKTYQQEPQFRISYENQQLNGAKVYIFWGERCDGQSKPWSNWKQELKPIGPSTYEVGLMPGITIVDYYGKNRCTNLEFAFQIETNGSVVWDNGGAAPLGFYSVAMPSTATLGKVGDLSKWESLEVMSKHSGFDY